MQVFKKFPATLLILLAGTGWGIIGLFTRKLSALGMSVIQVAFARCIVTLILCTLILVFFDRKAFKIEIRDIWMFIVTGIVSIVFFNLCYFYTIEITTLSVAAILLYSAPSFVVILSALFFHDKITLKILSALIIASVGCLLTTGLVGSSISIPEIGIVTGILSGFFYAVYSIAGTIALKKYSTSTVVFYTFVFASLGLLPFSDPVEFLSLSMEPQILLNMILIGLISTLLPYFLYSEGLSRMEPGRASILAFSEPMVATVLGILVFHEALTWVNALGILLIFCSILLLNTKKAGTS